MNISNKKLGADRPFTSLYETKKTIGKGTFGKVKLGVSKKSKEVVAIKVLEKSKMISHDDQERVKREVSILNKFSHIGVVKIYEIIQDKEKYYIIMEYCEKGELFNRIVKKQRLPEEEASYFFYQLINGLEYIHQHGVVHRDLKPENLLITKDNILKIIDFGLSNYFDGKSLLSTPCGSPCYASPEMVSGNKYNGFNIDVWATGIILYAMVCGYLPFEDPNNEVLFQKILKCDLDIPKHVSAIAKDLMKKILVTDPNKRIKIPSIKKHAFYLKGERMFKSQHPNLYALQNEASAIDNKEMMMKKKNNVNEKNNNNKFENLNEIENRLNAMNNNYNNKSKSIAPKRKINHNEYLSIKIEGMGKDEQEKLMEKYIKKNNNDANVSGNNNANSRSNLNNIDNSNNNNDDDSKVKAKNEKSITDKYNTEYNINNKENENNINLLEKQDHNNNNLNDNTIKKYNHINTEINPKNYNFTSLNSQKTNNNNNNAYQNKFFNSSVSPKNNLFDINNNIKTRKEMQSLQINAPFHQRPTGAFETVNTESPSINRKYDFNVSNRLNTEHDLIDTNLYRSNLNTNNFGIRSPISTYTNRISKRPVSNNEPNSNLNFRTNYRKTITTDTAWSTNHNNINSKRLNDANMSEKISFRADNNYLAGEFIHPNSISIKKENDNGFNNLNNNINTSNNVLSNRNDLNFNYNFSRGGNSTQLNNPSYTTNVSNNINLNQPQHINNYLATKKYSSPTTRKELSFPQNNYFINNPNSYVEQNIKGPNSIMTNNAIIHLNVHETNVYLNPSIREKMYSNKSNNFTNRRSHTIYNNRNNNTDYSSNISSNYDFGLNRKKRDLNINSINSTNINSSNNTFLSKEPLVTSANGRKNEINTNYKYNINTDSNNRKIRAKSSYGNNANINNHYTNNTKNNNDLNFYDNYIKTELNDLNNFNTNNNRKTVTDKFNNDLLFSTQSITRKRFNEYSGLNNKNLNKNINSLYNNTSKNLRITTTQTTRNKF